MDIFLQKSKHIGDMSVVDMAILTTPGDRTKMRGVLVVESSTTCCMSRTGGSVNLEPRLLMMKEVAQKDTRSGRNERTNNILWSSLQALSHSPVKSNETCLNNRLHIRV